MLITSLALGSPHAVIRLALAAHPTWHCVFRIDVVAHVSIVTFQLAFFRSNVVRASLLAGFAAMASILVVVVYVATVRARMTVATLLAAPRTLPLALWLRCFRSLARHVPIVTFQTEFTSRTRHQKMKTIATPREGFQSAVSEPTQTILLRTASVNTSAAIQNHLKSLIVSIVTFRD